jgi:hypothetical protein
MPSAPAADTQYLCGHQRLGSSSLTLRTLFERLSYASSHHCLLAQLACMVAEHQVLILTTACLPAAAG